METVLLCSMRYIQIQSSCFPLFFGCWVCPYFPVIESFGINFLLCKYWWCIIGFGSVEILIKDLAYPLIFTFWTRHNCWVVTAVLPPRDAFSFSKWCLSISISILPSFLPSVHLACLMTLPVLWRDIHWQCKMIFTLLVYLTCYRRLVSFVNVTIRCLYREITCLLSDLMVLHRQCITYFIYNCQLVTFNLVGVIEILSVWDGMSDWRLDLCRERGNVIEKFKGDKSTKVQAYCQKISNFLKNWN